MMYMGRTPTDRELSNLRALGLILGAATLVLLIGAWLWLVGFLSAVPA